jgi:hypothetical protein
MLAGASVGVVVGPLGPWMSQHLIVALALAVPGAVILSGLLSFGLMAIFAAVAW